MNDALVRELVAADGRFSGQEITGVTPVGGGCIHQAFAVAFATGEQVFVKAGAAAVMPMFAVESEALEALFRFADPAMLVVPRPIGSWLLPSGAVLVLPWLELSSGDQTALGRGLACLHGQSAAVGPGRFGWHRNGFIGSGRQPGGWSDRWGDAFVDLRLRPQISAAARWGLQLDDLLPLLQAIAEHLNALELQPSLVHGDLWGGNAGSLNDGRGAIYDPAAYWADPEVDLAMTRMFGGFSTSFYDAYAEVIPQRSGARQRVDLYNLYHVLNHANLFGGSYQQQSRDMLKALARLWL